MSAFEYRAVPAPRKGKSGKGTRGAPAKFANAVTGLMNEMGTDGWEYLRADTLPCEERQGLTGKTVKYHSMLVFRRPVEEVATEVEEAEETLALAAPVDEPEPVEEPEIVEETVDAAPEEDMPEPANDDAEKRDHVAAE
ncbi:DUF4177 domain-containing protein [uncultured Litoreibacter sp.]|uniref:DUF4177 domain-containing protein n=1 Tax=uncultured Litoreibacter sp. TaxID=1392394 RepID=UPI00260E8C41|nr:DUF4177 domain-containing protein [uncultured Litoreibacter sp.]